MPRGGYRDPGPRKPPAGPGKFSQRTDAQVVATPDLDRPDVQYGDVKTSRVGQKVQPIPAPKPLPPALGAQVRGGLPPWLFDRPSSRPEEPVTAGLRTGPGPGPEALMVPPEEDVDIREVVLSYLHFFYGNLEAARMLQEIRASKQVTPVSVGPAPMLDATATSLEMESPFGRPFEEAGEASDRFSEAPEEVPTPETGAFEEEAEEVPEEGPPEEAG